MTLIPAKHTFTIWQGSTFFEILTLYETNDNSRAKDFYDRTNPNSPILIYSAEMIIRDKPRGGIKKINNRDAILSTSSQTVGKITFPSEVKDKGKIHLNIADSDTIYIDWKAGVYDLTISQLQIGTNPQITNTLLYGGIRVLGV